jgi:adenosylcobinamide-GDP ribazoletransferase
VGLKIPLGVVANLPRAVQGALSFLTRLPVGGGERAWTAFRQTPAAFPLAGLVVGAVLALPFVLGALLALPPGATVALYLFALVGLTGVTHADGLADLADAAAVHERHDAADPAAAAARRRREVLKDSALGVGGALAVVAATVALALGALDLATTAAGGGLTPATAAATVVVAEVAAKTAMGVLTALGSAAHEGLGSQLVGANGPGTVVGVGLGTLPAVAVAGLAASLGPAEWAVGVGVSAVAVAAAVLVALAVWRWASTRLGGVSGDAFGAANELGRLAALHAGVVAWTLL